MLLVSTCKVAFIIQTYTVTANAWVVLGMQLQKIPVIELEVLRQWRLVLQVNYPYILTDHNQTYIICSACVDGALLIYSGKSLQWKLRYGQVCISFSKQSTLNYPPIAINVSVCNDCEEGVTCKVAGSYQQWRAGYRWKSTLFYKWSALNYWKMQPNSYPLYCMRGSCCTWNFRKIAPMKQGYGQIDLGLPLPA